MSRLRPFHSLAMAAFLFGPIGFLVPLGLAPLLALSALLVVIFKRFDEKSWPQFNRNHLLFFGAFILFGALSGLWGLVPGNAFKQALILSGVVFAGLVLLDAGQNITAGEREYIGKILVISAIFALTLLIFEYLSNGLLAKTLRNADETNSLSVYRRSAAALALLLWPLLLTVNQKLPRIGKGLVFVCGTLAIYVLDNQTASGSIIIGGMSYLVFRFSPVKLLKLLGVVVVLGILIAPVLPRTLLHPDSIQSGHLSSLKHRYIIWGFTAEKIIEKPILGWGLNSARSIPGGSKNVIPGTHGQALPLHPHNGILQIWLELGFVGAIFLATFVYYLVSGIRKPMITRSDKSVLASGLVAGLVIFCSSFGIWQAWWMSALIFTGIFLNTLSKQK